MKRSRLTIEEISGWETLLEAFGRAAQGKSGRRDAEAFRANLEQNLMQLQNWLLCRDFSGNWPFRPLRSFAIRDPKSRTIHAPCFQERVLHHALMAHVGPVLDRSLIADSFACRLGKGSLAAVRRAQTHLRRWPWYASIDIRQYFPNVHHKTLLGKLARKFSDHDLLNMFEAILLRYETSSGRGLPIGALTSQNFANFYLGDADRLALETCGAGGYVRYMDDMIWWGESRAAVRSICSYMQEYLRTHLCLEVKSPVQIGQSCHGLSFCGYRIFADQVLLSRRRKARYNRARKAAERAFEQGSITGQELQSRMDTALAITAHAESLAWRKQHMKHQPLAACVFEA